MPVVTYSLPVRTGGDDDVLDLTPAVARQVLESPLQHGLATLFVSGSTAGLTTIEFEPGVVNDLRDAIRRLAPRDIPYAHEQAWHDGNGHSHVRAALLGPSLTVPFRDRRLLLGTWQQIVLIDFDNRPRRRELVLQLMGD